MQDHEIERQAKRSLEICVEVILPAVSEALGKMEAEEISVNIGCLSIINILLNRGIDTSEILFSAYCGLSPGDFLKQIQLESDGDLIKRVAAESNRRFDEPLLLKKIEDENR